MNETVSSAETILNKKPAYNVVPIQLYYTLSSRHARVTLREDKTEKLTKEKLATPLRDYIDWNGNILCIKTERILKIRTSYIAVKTRHKKIYEIYIPPDIKDIIGGYNPLGHIRRYLEDAESPELLRQFKAQKELARELDIPYAGSNKYSSCALSAQLLLDRLAKIMELEEFRNPWYVNPDTGRKYESQDM